ncbi:MAG: hypothetical protein QW521_02245 [Desulfurococcaceae archaeon]
MEATFTGKVERNNRIWIPRAVREMLKLYEGCYVEVKIRRIEAEGMTKK